MNQAGPMMDRPVSEISGAVNRLAGAISEQEGLAEEIRSRLAPILSESPTGLVACAEKRAEIRSPFGRELTELADRVDTNNRLIRKLLEDCQI